MLRHYEICIGLGERCCSGSLWGKSSGWVLAGPPGSFQDSLVAVLSMKSDKKPPVTDAADDSSENEELLKSEILGLREQLTVLKEDNKRSSDNERRKLSAAKSELRKALTQNEDLSKKLGEAARQIMELQAQIDTGNSVVAPE